MNFTFIFLLLSSTAFMQISHAYEDESVRGYIDSRVYPGDELFQTRPSVKSKNPSKEVAPGERIRKLNLALDSLKIPHESDPDFSDFPSTSKVSFEEVQKRLGIFDPDGVLQKYLNLEPTSVTLTQDYWSELLPSSLTEFTLGLKPNGDSEDSVTLLSRLEKVSRQVKSGSQQPLKGLKIVIDPGHMGTEFWDTQTGKFVEIRGVRVSEGQLNLWTSLLVANELEALGAEVTLTRSVDGPVSSQSLSQFDVSPYLNQYFYSALDDWMDPFFSLDDQAFLKAVKNSPATKSAYSTTQKTQFYILGEDLDARSKIIDAKKPDIVIDIHFDADKANQLQSTSNNLEAFVPGNFGGDEIGSRSVKMFALKHLLETRRWDESVNLATEITSHMSQELNVPLEGAKNFYQSLKIKDGVYARNLYINRRNLSALMVYLECLHYDHKKEFPILAQKDQTSSYRGMTFQHSSRLNLIAKGVRDGILSYFRN